MRNLIIIPFHDFKTIKNGFRTRDAHLYEYFVKNETLDNVVIINRPTSLVELFLRKKKILTTKNVIYKNKYCYIQKLKNNIYIIDLLVFDIFQVVKMRHAWLPYIYSRKDVISKINDALSFLNIIDASVYMSSPFSVELGNQIKANFRLLDAVDNFAMYKEWNFFQNRIKELYTSAKKNYDMIYVNSQESFDFMKKDCRADLKLIPNGVDSFKFRGKFETPSDLPKGKKIVGYAGKIQRMFNPFLLAELAQKHPDCNFVLLGKFLDKKWKTKHWDNYLAKFDNVFFLGDKPYSDLPAYYNSFDICMIPYFIEEQHGGDPIKFYEYMACNKPIISTAIGNIEKYHNGHNIMICANEGEFLTNFDFLKNNLDKKILHEIPEEMEWKAISSKTVEYMFDKEG